MTAADPPAAKSSPSLAGHLPALDAVRGLAILAVTAFRFAGGPPAEWGWARAGFQVLNQGYRGVDLFFVLSGFLITGILFDAKGRDGYFRNFYVRRTLRIFPLYYAVLLVALVLIPLVVPAGYTQLSQPPPGSAWLWVYGTNVAQALDEVPGNPETGWPLGSFNHFWSLAVEEHFYLAWPLVIALASRATAMRACVALFAAALVCRIALILGLHREVAAEVLTPCRLDALVAGAWFALALRGPGGLASLLPWAKLACFGGAGLTLATLVGRKLLPLSADLEQAIHYGEYSSFALFCAGLIVLAVAAPRGTWLAWLGNQRWLHLAGKYSYGWYVFQGLIVPDLRHWLPAESLAQWCGSATLGRLCHLALGAAISFALAWLSWHWLEKRILALKDVLAPTASQPAPAPPPPALACSARS